MAHQNIWVKCWNSETPLCSIPVTLLMTRMEWLSSDKLESLWAKKRNGHSTSNVWNTTYVLTPLMGRIGDVQCSCQPSVRKSINCCAVCSLLWSLATSPSLNWWTFLSLTTAPNLQSLYSATGFTRASDNHKRPWQYFVRTSCTRTELQLQRYPEWYVAGSTGMRH